MTYDRYYYSKLDDTQKAAYKKAYAAFERFENTILFDGAKTSVEDVLRVLYAIDLDNPHMYYVDFGKIEIKCNTRFVLCDAAYFYNRTEIAQIQPKIQKTTNAILKRVSGATTYEKVLSLHDILAENILYDDNAADDIDKYYLKSNTILGVLFFKTAVCGGISKTFKLLLNMLDVKCLIVIGDTNENADKNVKHAWNIVKIEGAPYHIDLTWDVNRSFPNAISHAYFCLSDKNAIKTHSWKLGDIPTCTGGRSYYIEHDLIAKTNYDICRIIDSACAQGRLSVEIQTNISKSINDYAELCMRVIKHHPHTKAAVEVGMDASSMVVLFRWTLRGEDFQRKSDGKNVILAQNKNAGGGLFESIKDFLNRFKK